MKGKMCMKKLMCNIGRIFKKRRNIVIAGVVFIGGVVVICAPCFYNKDVILLKEYGSISSKSMMKCDEELDSDLSDSINSFAFELYENLEMQNTNMLISPFSVYTSLVMIDNATTGKIKAEFENVLSIDDLDKTNEQLNTYINKLMEDEVNIEISNSLWLNKNYKVTDESKKLFFDPVKRYFNTDSFVVDLAKEESYEKINDWISLKTDGMIDPFYENTKEETEFGELKLLELVNAVSFNGEWEDKFDPDNSYNGTFYGATETTDVIYMKQEDMSYKYIYTEGMKAISLPYKGDIAMDIIISNGNALKEFNDLTADEKKEFFTKLNSADIHEISEIVIPRFSLKSEKYDLLPTLEAMGINDTILGNLDEDYYISQCNHMANIEVNEDGTKAVAVTQVEAVMIGDSFTFKVNKPFVFTLRDESTNTILFIGKVDNL